MSELRRFAVYGINEPRPLMPLPEGCRYRVRMRADTFATLVLRTREGRTERWYLRYTPDGQAWEPFALQGINTAPQNT